MPTVILVLMQRQNIAHQAWQNFSSTVSGIRLRAAHEVTCGAYAHVVNASIDTITNGYAWLLPL